MSPSAFQQAMMRGMAASPFKGAVTLMIGNAEHPVENCVVESGDNAAKAEEYGLQHVRTLSVQMPKKTPVGVATLPERPETKHKLKYLGRIYNLTSIEGDDEASPVWVLEGNAPL